MNDYKFVQLFSFIFFYLSKFFCMSPFSINWKKIEISLSKVSIVVSLTILGLYLLFNKHLTETAYANHEFYYSNNFRGSAESFLFLKTYFLIAISITWSVIKAKHWIYCFSEFKIFVKLLKKEIFVYILRNRINHLIHIQILVWISFLFNSYLYCFLPKETPSFGIIFFYIPLKEYPICIINILVAQQHLILIIFESSLKALNVFLKAQVNNSMNDLIVDKVAEIHFRIIKISKYFYQHFSFLILMICFDGLLNYTFEAFLVYLYSMLYYRGKVDEKLYNKFIINTVCLGGYSVLRIIQIIIILDGRCRGQNEVSNFFICKD